jgi:RNA polymerase sigma-70 factor, ECF subfamily
LHSDTPRDWGAELARLTASPVVELNRAIAVAETEGPDVGRRIVDRLGLR